MSDSPCREAVLWPLSRKAVKKTAAATRLPNLNGKTIVELWDVIFRGETIYPLVREYIRKRFPGVKFVSYSEFGNFHGPREHEVTASIPDKLRAHKAELVPLLAGMTSESVVVALEAAGVPVGPVLDIGQVLDSPESASRRMVVGFDRDDAGWARVLTGTAQTLFTVHGALGRVTAGDSKIRDFRVRLVRDASSELSRSGSTSPASD